MWFSELMKRKGESWWLAGKWTRKKDQLKEKEVNDEEDAALEADFDVQFKF